MIKGIYTLTICLLFSLQAMSQQTLSGTIQASDKTALISASVVATDSNGAEFVTISDVNGNSP